MISDEQTDNVRVEEPFNILPYAHTLFYYRLPLPIAAVAITALAFRDCPPSQRSLAEILPRVLDTR